MPAVVATDGFAALPMYDWPELREPMDRLWKAIARELRRARLPAPARLAREFPWDAQHRRHDLVLGQTCGLPLATSLVGTASLVGTFDLGLEHCPPGHYRSALLVREGAAIDSLEAAHGARLAVNHVDSQSGLHSIAGLLADGAEPHFGTALVSGAHRRSIEWLSSGHVDIAAIDCHSLRLARRFGPAPEGLRCIGYTPACPGTPLITARHADAVRIADAVEHALAALDPASRDALSIRGLWRARPSDYAPLADPRVARRAHRELTAGGGLPERRRADG